ncbi:MAG: chromosomal replication initiator protein DnaA [Victivallales bacterium]|jgi:chromosomal replication initiator protein|nr:chromosomal replication initiator protein DnaA [Victivallales bacterium]
MDSRDNSAENIWSVATDRLKTQNTHLYSQWFKKITPLSIEGDTLKLGVSDDFFGSIIEREYDDLVLAALSDIDGIHYNYSLEPGHEPELEKLITPEVKSNTKVTPKSEIPARETNSQGCLGEHTFENFVVGAENRFGYAAARAVAEAPGKVYNPLFLYGISGVGKTHLLHAIASTVCHNSRKMVVRSTTCDELLNDFYYNLLDKKNLTKFRSNLRDVDVLLIDDVQMLSGKTQMQVEFFNVFNMLYNKHKQIVLTSDRQPCEIEDLDKRLETRFEQGMTAEVCPPEYEARLSILRMMRSETLVQDALDDALLEFLAKNIASNVRRLRGAFIRLASHASFSGGKLAIEQAEELLQCQLSQECSAKDLSIAQIQQTVATHFGITMADLLGEKRNRGIAEPRMVAMYLSRELTQCSSNDIGSAFRRNHATVLHAEKKVPTLSDTDDSLRRAISQIKRQLQKH